MNIPRILMQTSKSYDERASSMLLNSFSGWEYFHFNDQQCIDYMTNNKIDGVDNPVEKYLQYRLGAHRADFFRYYYLYINGGGFIDSDLMIYKDIDEYLGEYDFVSVNSLECPGHIFQGFLFVTKNNKIILEALLEMYNSSDKKIEFINGNTAEGYLAVTKDLNNIIAKNKDGNVLLFDESPHFYYLSQHDGQKYAANGIGTKDSWFGVHWQKEKIVYDYHETKEYLVYL